MFNLNRTQWRKRAHLGAIAALGLAVCACSGAVRSELDGLGDGAGLGAGEGEMGLGFDQGTGAGNTGFCGTDLTGTVRDFRIDHPDFEYQIATETGIVASKLGADGKPVYLGGSGLSTTGKDNFDQWYNDVAGVNLAQPLTIQLKALAPANGESGIYSYDNQEFFPIDGGLWGNEGNPHNYHFTYEIHAQFLYSGGEVFGFTGDDDLFVFVNGTLAIDLGGVHGALSGQVDLDAQAQSLGIEVGKTYALDFFFAERHLVDSHFRIDTTLAFTGCGAPKPK